jgi:sulfotransferase
MKNFHFISGLPRSGSTMLSSILKQNPKFHAGVSSNLIALIRTCYEQMNQHSEFRTSKSEQIQKQILMGIFQNYYEDQPQPVVFDTNRLWCNMMYLTSELFPDSKFLICVRDILSIMNSFERMRNQNPLKISTVFPANVDLNVYTRVRSLMEEGGVIGSPLQALKTAYCSEFRHKLFLIEYDEMCANPEGMMRAIYNLLGEPYFAHDFDNIEDAHDEYDAALNMPNLHKVRKQLKPQHRLTTLPPDIQDTYRNLEFWRESCL